MSYYSSKWNTEAFAPTNIDLLKQLAKKFDFGLYVFNGMYVLAFDTNESITTYKELSIDSPEATEDDDDFYTPAEIAFDVLSKIITSPLKVYGKEYNYYTLLEETEEMLDVAA